MRRIWLLGSKGQPVESEENRVSIVGKQLKSLFFLAPACDVSLPGEENGA